jgi:serine/threonine protein kinase
MVAPSRFIARYEIQQRLGTGGMGAIFLARDPVIDRLVAIKLLHADLADEDLRRRFAQEARASGALSHPHIVVIHDYGEHEGAPYIVMEYLRGETLAELIRRRAETPLDQKLRWVEHVCAALAYAHDKGIIHRDIKPSNLIVDQHGTIKVLDFGIARIVGASATRASSTVGTPGYMSPEQIEGLDPDKRTDIFSLGAVLYELLAYRPAFSGPNAAAIMNRVLRDEPAPLEEFVSLGDSALAEVVATALQKDRDKRYADMRMLERKIAAERKRLEAGATDGTVVLPAGTVFTPPPSPRRRTDPAEIARRRAEQIEQRLADAREAMSASDLEEAAIACEDVLLLDPANDEALAILAATRDEPQLVEMFVEAGAALDRREFPEAERIVAQLERLDANHPEVARLRRELRTRLEQQERELRRARELAEAYNSAFNLFDAGALDAAERSLAEALALDPTHGPSLDLRKQIADRREALRQKSSTRRSVAPPSPPPPTPILSSTPPPVQRTASLAPEPRPSPLPPVRPATTGSPRPGPRRAAVQRPRFAVAGSAALVLVTIAAVLYFALGPNRAADNPPVDQGSSRALNTGGSVPLNGSGNVPVPPVMSGPTGSGLMPGNETPPPSIDAKPAPVATVKKDDLPAAGSTPVPAGASRPGVALKPLPPSNTPAAPNVTPILAEADIAANNEQFDTALALYQKVLKLDPDNAEATSGIKRVIAVRRNRANRFIREAQRLFTEDADIDGAIRALKSALAVDPGNQLAAQLLKKVEQARDALNRRRKPAVVQ